jgi:hypothetical protein
MEDPSRCLDLAVATVVTRDYLHYARALAVSVRETNPGVPIYICLVDRPPQPYDPSAEPATILFADELDIPNWRRFAFQYDAFELSCALKPLAMQRVLDEGFQQVVYLDADVQVYASLAGIRDRLGDAPIILSPHLDGPLPDDGKQPDETSLLRVGIFNGGFVGVSRSTEGRRFLSWWSERLKRNCIASPELGFFVDQRWLDHVPVFFPSTHIERGPGYNAAYWNLASRRVWRGTAGRLMANDAPLVFFHFSGFRPQAPHELSRYQDRFRLGELPVVQELALGYLTRLDSLGRGGCEQWGYAYDRLTDGMAIEPSWREAVRVGHALVADVEDPFRADAFPDWTSRLERAGGDCWGGRLGWVVERCSSLERQVAELQSALAESCSRKWFRKSAGLLRWAGSLIRWSRISANGSGRKEDCAVR